MQGGMPYSLANATLAFFSAFGKFSLSIGNKPLMAELTLGYLYGASAPVVNFINCVGLLWLGRLIPATKPRRFIQ